MWNLLLRSSIYGELFLYVYHLHRLVDLYQDESLGTTMSPIAQKKLGRIPPLP